MKNFHERWREATSDIVIVKNASTVFSLHYHINMEILIVKNGTYCICVNGHRYTLTNGSIAVIDSYTPHSYDTDNKNNEIDSYVLLIPPEYIRRFNMIRNNAKIINPVIKDNELCNQIIYLVSTYIKTDLSNSIKTATLDLIFNLFYKYLVFSENSNVRDEDFLIKKIIEYVEVNFKTPITRYSIAKELGYTEAHISRTFHKYMKTNISNYINLCRLDFIEELRSYGDTRTITALLYEAGFTSPQSYYRIKQKKI